ncbi:MAG: PHP domain-containing protein, partial [Candidatus Paceibacterota bacterium]
MKVDLHLHSNNSDGKFKPSEVVKRLAKSRVDFAVLTDHDSIDGSVEFAKSAARYGIKTTHGVEISASQNGIGLHILGYGIDIKDPRFKKLFKKQMAERKKKFLRAI